MDVCRRLRQDQAWWPEKTPLSCRHSLGPSRGNVTCRGGACPTAPRLLACLPPCRISNSTEAPSWFKLGLRWGLRLWQAARRRLAACALGRLARFGFGLSFANDLPDKVLSV